MLISFHQSQKNKNVYFCFFINVLLTSWLCLLRLGYSAFWDCPSGKDMQCCFKIIQKNVCWNAECNIAAYTFGTAISLGVRLWCLKCFGRQLIKLWNGTNVSIFEFEVNVTNSWLQILRVQYVRLYVCTCLLYGTPSLFLPRPLDPRQHPPSNLHQIWDVFTHSSSLAHSLRFITHLSPDNFVRLSTKLSGGNSAQSLLWRNKLRPHWAPTGNTFPRALLWPC